MTTNGQVQSQPIANHSNDSHARAMFTVFYYYYLIIIRINFNMHTMQGFGLQAIIIKCCKVDMQQTPHYRKGTIIGQDLSCYSIGLKELSCLAMSASAVS